MGRLATWAMLALAGLGLGGCAASIPPVEVTRFFSDAPAPTGTIAIVNADGGIVETMEFRTLAAAVGQELQRLGFTEANAAADSLYVARLSVVRTDRAPLAARRSPVSVGVGGSTGSYGSGLGLGIGIDLSGPPKGAVATSMSVQIRRRADDQPLWEGRASTEAREGSPAAQPGLAAGKLAAALFKGYPGESGRTITVP